MITATAACRADFAGGTLDIWPLGILHAGSRTVNVALDITVTVQLRGRSEGYAVLQEGLRVEAATLEELSHDPDGALVGVVGGALGLPPVEVELVSGSPRGGGLGGSSAMAVALIAAGEELTGVGERSPTVRAHLARDLEARLLSLPTGTQDYYPALLGGALEIHHRPGGEEVQRLDVDLEKLGRSLLVVYTGLSHFSAANNWQIIRRRLEGEPEVAARFSAVAGVAAEIGGALEAGDLRRVGELVGQEWSYRRRLADGVTTPEVEELLSLATSLGAWGGKACGAGGGGCIMILCPPEAKESIAERLTAAGGMVIDARPTQEALRVVRTGD